MGVKLPPPPPPPPNPFLIECPPPDDSKGARLVDRKETLIEKKEREAQEILRVHNIDVSKMSKRESESVIRKITNSYKEN